MAGLAWVLGGIWLSLEGHEGRESSSIAKLPGAENLVLDPVNLALQGLQKRREVLHYFTWTFCVFANVNFVLSPGDY